MSGQGTSSASAGGGNLFPQLLSSQQVTTAGATWWSNNKDEHYYMKRGEEFEGKGDFPTALRKYSKAIEIRINFVEALIKRGQIFEQLGCTQEAKKDYEEALRLNPNQPRVQGYLQRLEQFLARGEEASKGTRFNRDQHNEAMQWANHLAEGGCD